MNRRTKNYLKYIAACSLRIVTRVFYVFPIKHNRILFNTYDGKHICCNPKAIFEGMMKRYPGQFEYVWTLDKDEEIQQYIGEKIRVVPLRSLQFYIMKATAKVCVVNSASFPEIPLRKKQFQIYTHHGGGAYKTAGAAIKGADTKSNIKKLKWDAANTSLFISSSQYFTDEVIRKQKLFDGEVYAYGMPRNDKLVNHNYAEARNKVYAHYGLANSTHIVLYAPTYKDTSKNTYEPIDIKTVIEAAKNRFGGEWVFLIRTHYLGKNSDESKNAILATDYPDMQDLLAAADILISDYSSSIWDYSFTGKPCLLYTPDVDEYIANRGFDTPIETWGYPVCRTNQLLIETIQNWNEEQYNLSIKKHHDNLGSQETGQATEKVCERLYRECFGK